MVDPKGFENVWCVEKGTGTRADQSLLLHRSRPIDPIHCSTLPEEAPDPFVPFGLSLRQ